MLINTIKLNNFRNYSRQTIDFNDKINIIYGDNAQGKTNILEAVNMFVTGKAHRTSRDKELIKFGETFCELEIEFVSHERKQKSNIKCFDSAKKQVSINEIPIKRMSELVGVFNVVLFCPEHLGLVRDGAKKRRTEIDVLISQLRPKYFAALLNYQKVLANKNVLLKTIRKKPQNEGFLETLNEQLSNFGAIIIKYRDEYIKKLQHQAEDVHKEITKENYSLKYRTNIDYKTEMTEEDVRCTLLEKMNAGIIKEKEFGSAITGPHRDDVEFFINEKEVKTYGSQGQMKTSILTLKLAELNLIEKETKEKPVLLLDDIMSELDNNRQFYILEKIQNQQVLITCTDIEKYKNLINSKMFHVESGNIIF